MFLDSNFEEGEKMEKKKKRHENKKCIKAGRLPRDALDLYTQRGA